MELYFEGGTTLAQEEVLRRFFDRGDIPADLWYAHTMFAGFAAIGREGCGAGADTGMAVDGMPEASKGMEPAQGIAPDSRRGTRIAEGNVPESGKGVKPTAFRTKARRVYMSVSIAAAMLAAAGITWSVVDRQPTVYCYLNGEPVTNMKTAERQAEMAMRILRGSAKASAEGLETAREVAGKPIERVASAVRNTAPSISADGEE